MSNINLHLTLDSADRLIRYLDSAKPFCSSSELTEVEDMQSMLRYALESERAVQEVVTTTTTDTGDDSV